jgi:hypothetical protein
VSSEAYLRNTAPVGARAGIDDPLSVHVLLIFCGPSEDALRRP